MRASTQLLLQVVASDLSPSAVPIGEIDWSVPTAVVLGNEERGISHSMRNIADATFVIPMRGFVRSFNMSVACSIILAHLSAVRYGGGDVRCNFLLCAMYDMYICTCVLLTLPCHIGVFWVAVYLGHVKGGQPRPRQGRAAASTSPRAEVLQSVVGSRACPCVASTAVLLSCCGGFPTVVMFACVPAAQQ